VGSLRKAQNRIVAEVKRGTAYDAVAAADAWGAIGELPTSVEARTLSVCSGASGRVPAAGRSRRKLRGAGGGALLPLRSGSSTRLMISPGASRDRSASPFQPELQGPPPANRSRRGSASLRWMLGGAELLRGRVAGHPEGRNRGRHGHFLDPRGQKVRPGAALVRDSARERKRKRPSSRSAGSEAENQTPASSFRGAGPDAAAPRVQGSCTKALEAGRTQSRARGGARWARIRGRLAAAAPEQEL